LPLSSTILKRDFQAIAMAGLPMPVSQAQKRQDCCRIYFNLEISMRACVGSSSGLAQDQPQGCGLPLGLAYVTAAVLSQSLHNCSGHPPVISWEDKTL
jgi:hypothetical protein